MYYSVWNLPVCILNFLGGSGFGITDSWNESEQPGNTKTSYCS